jgi:nucleoside-diphosphate-sugar epimerase
VLANADDYYTITKKKQEELIENCGIPHSVLRPTLMFGWFDKEHFGWLFRFMQTCPIFPVPGDGKFLRQPLYYRDMASCCIAAAEMKWGGAYNITGRDEITYIDIMREIKRIRKLHTLILPIPSWLFKFLLEVYAIFFKSPPFTSQQLDALVAGDKFETPAWWDEFGVTPTPLKEAFETTFSRGGNSEIELKKDEA